MTGRLTRALDRVASLLLGLVLLGGGALAIWWWTGRSPLLDRLDLARPRTWVDSAWWPWAAGAAGVVLVLLGLRWLVAHVSRRGVGRLHLHGSGPRGRLDVSASALARAAGEAFGDTLGVRSVSSGVIRDRRETVIRLRATVAPEADLAAVAAHADRVAGQLGRALERPDVRCKVELKVAPLPRAVRATH